MKTFALILVGALGLASARFPGDGVDNLDQLLHLEGQPFMLPVGVPYRDMLTIGASEAVGVFAAKYQPEERQKVSIKATT